MPKRSYHVVFSVKSTFLEAARRCLGQGLGVARPGEARGGGGALRGLFLDAHGLADAALGRSSDLHGSGSLPRGHRAQHHRVGRPYRALAEPLVRANFHRFPSCWALFRRTTSRFGAATARISSLDSKSACRRSPSTSSSSTNRGRRCISKLAAHSYRDLLGTHLSPMLFA